MMNSVRVHRCLLHVPRGQCSVAVVEKTLSMEKEEGEIVMFHSMCEKQKLSTISSTGMSYSYATELVKREITKEGLDLKEFGQHSLMY